jgi:hypothetical protein
MSSSGMLRRVALVRTAVKTSNLTERTLHHFPKYSRMDR